MMNPFDLLKNAQNIKGELEKIQGELKNISVTGSSGGGIVKVLMDGTLRISAVHIDPIAVDPRDVSMLQDLIVSAAHDAQKRVQEAVKEKTGAMLQGMNIPDIFLPGLLGQ